jgi:tRNA (mo5U34)-methyltransferase
MSSQMSNSATTRELKPPPANFSAKEFFAGVHWHQRWELFQGVFTPGRNPVHELCAYAQLPEDLSGKRVLDIGAWNGCFSFECERRGATDVVAYSLENPHESGFDRLKSLLDSRVSYVQGSVYSLSPEELGRFDVILFFGVLYHLRYPLLAIDRLRAVSNGSVFVETHVVSHRMLLRAPLAALGGLFRLGWLFKATPIWRQYREYELHPQDQSNWFGPNPQAVLESFQSAGFEIHQSASWGDRAAFRADVKRELPERLLSGTYDSVSPVDARLAGISARRTGLFAEANQQAGSPGAKDGN